MARHVLQSCQRNPEHSVGWSIGRLQNPSDHIFVLVLFLGIEIQTVVRLEGVTGFQPETLSNEGSHHCFAIPVFKPTPSAHQTEATTRSSLGLGEEVGERANDAIAQVVVANRDRNSQSHCPVGRQCLEIGKRDISRGRLEVEQRIEDQLKLRPTSTENGIPGAGLACEGGPSLAFDHPDRHQQSTGQRQRKGRHHGRKQVLAQAASNQKQQRHRATPFRDA